MPAPHYIATIGTFDGLHTGHRALLQLLRREGQSRGLLTMAVTFDRHPLSVVAPQAMPPQLSSDADRVGALRRCGDVDNVMVLTFDDSTRAMTARQFMQRLHASGVRALLMGYDHCFGSDRPHGLDKYAAIGHDVGIEVVPSNLTVSIDGHAVSSSAIRQALSQADIATATAMLGHPYTITATVVHGRGDGHRLGFPTANMDVPPTLCLPANGVYAATATWQGHTAPAMLNIGTCPTLTDGKRRTVEACIIDPPVTPQLYGRQLTVQLTGHLRDERRFDSLQQLVAQLGDDRRQVLAMQTKHKCRPIKHN